MAENMICFYGHHAKTPGVVGPHVFSQWWPAPFTVEGVRYATAEHWMMAAKAKMCNDDDALRRIMETDDPAAAKFVGRHVKNWNESAWVGCRLDVVIEGSYHKFYQNKELGDYLLSTGTSLLVEASPSDKIWGVGMKASDPRITNPRLWEGLNLLGMALMVARGDLMLRRHLDKKEIEDALNDAKGG